MSRLPPLLPALLAHLGPLIDPQEGFNPEIGAYAKQIASRCGDEEASVRVAAVRALGLMGRGATKYSDRIAEVPQTPSQTPKTEYVLGRRFTM